VRVDLRGHGESSTAPDYRMPSLVGDLRAVTDDLGIGTPAVVGHSLGASIAGEPSDLDPAVEVQTQRLRVSEGLCTTAARGRVTEGQRGRGSSARTDTRIGEHR
jgi:pimeloyl-ACP methyl ester carboxylesterase